MVGVDWTTGRRCKAVRGLGLVCEGLWPDAPLCTSSCVSPGRRQVGSTPCSTHLHTSQRQQRWAGDLDLPLETLRSLN